MNVNPRRRGAWVVSLTAMTGLGLVLPLIPASAAPVPPPDPNTAAVARPGPVVPVLTWVDCGAPYECATAVVPRDYDRPKGETFELALIRHRAPDQANKIGSIFMNPGGPGGSGVGFIRAAPPGVFNLFERFDVVSWDPRGIGLSTPGLDCTTDEEDKAVTNNVFTRPENADKQTLTREARDFGRACEQRNPGVLPYLSTANTARDLDLLRAAVGDEKLTYLGISHGTHIGATYSSLFPGNVRAMVADSPIDADTWVNRPRDVHRERITAGFEVSLGRFFGQCLAAGDRCGFGGEDPQDAFDALVDRLNVTPAPAPASVSQTVVNGDDVLDAAAHAMYTARDWSTLAAALVALEAGDGTLVRDYLDGEHGRQPDGSLPPSGAYIGTTAQDFQYDRRIQSYMDEGRHADAYSEHFFWLSQGYEEVVYPTWPVKQNDNFTGPWRHPADAAPALVVGVKHDPTTPYSMSERYTEQLGNAQLMTYDADGHGALTDLNFCLIGPFLTYITDLVLPPAGYTCDQEYEAFPDPSALSRSAQPQEWRIPRTDLAGVAR